MSFQSLLPSAIEDNDTTTLKSLLAADIDVNSHMRVLSGSVTPLGLAAVLGHADVARMLLDVGADINKKCHFVWDESDPNWIADYPSVDHPVDMYPVSCLPVHLAASHGYLDIVKLLFATRKVDLYAADCLGCNTLFHCLRSHNIELFQFLAPHYNLLENYGIHERTAFMYAVYFNNMEAFNLLCHLNPDVNAVDSRDRNALHWSMYQDNLTVINGLLERGCKVNVQDSDGETPLCLAVRLGKPNAVRRLCAVSDRRTRNNEGNYLLHLAVLSGNLEVVTILLDHGADIDKFNEEGHTALCLAVRDNQVDIVECLIKRGCNMNYPQPPYQFPLDLAVTLNDANMVEILVKGGADVDLVDVLDWTPLMNAVTHGFVEVSLKLMELGADVETTDTCQHRPLHAAVIRKDTPVVLALLQRGAMVNAQTATGLTPLMLATLAGLTSLVAILLQHNAEVNILDSRSNTAIMHAVKGKHVDIAKLLLVAGAKTTAPYCSLAHFHQGRSSGHSLANFLPLTLLQYCRLSLREHLGSQINNNIACLQLPKLMKDYLLFKDLEI